MKFLAWDVGIKNLAYSIIDYDTETHLKTIIEWGVVNLMTEVDAKPKEERICCETNMKGGKCTSKVVYLFSNDSTRGVCRKHQQIIKYKQHKFLDIVEKSLCCYETVKKTACEKTALYARKNDLTKTYCSMHLKIVQKIEPFEVYDMKQDKKEMVRAQPILTLSRRLYQHLDNIKDSLLNVDEVLIENQPVLKNPTMKTIQILLYAWFVMNGVLEKRINDIHFFSASKKLEAFDDKDNVLAKSVSHLSGQYQMNKKLAIMYTNEMIKNDYNWFNFFNSHHKKDDLADAYLTNCFFIDRHFKINKFAPKLKKNANSTATLTKKEIEINDDTKKAKKFTDNLIYDSDDNDEDKVEKEKEDKFSKLFPDLFGDKNEEDDEDEEEDEIIKIKEIKKPFKPFYKKYYPKKK